MGEQSLETVFKRDGSVIGANPDGRLGLVTAITASAGINDAQWPAGRTGKVLA